MLTGPNTIHARTLRINGPWRRYMEKLMPPKKVNHRCEKKDLSSGESWIEKQRSWAPTPGQKRPMSELVTKMCSPIVCSWRVQGFHEENSAGKDIRWRPRRAVRIGIMRKSIDLALMSGRTFDVCSSARSMPANTLIPTSPVRVLDLLKVESENDLTITRKPAVGVCKSKDSDAEARSRWSDEEEQDKNVKRCL